MKKTAKEISNQLAVIAKEVASHLFPLGKLDGNEWRVGSIEGEPGQSLAICVSGTKAGVWCDFAGDMGGDLLSLWSLKRNTSILGAMSEASLWMGNGSVNFEPPRKKLFLRPTLKNAIGLIDNSVVKNYLNQDRKLSDETLKAFKISERGREILFPFFRQQELIQIKSLGLDRVEGKKIIRVSKDCEPCLFGWDTLPLHGREVTICEGEIDAMSLYQVGIPALSVPFGGGAGAKQQWIENEYDRLLAFDKIYLCLDNDKVGEEAALEIIDRLGCHRCYIVNLPCKDANECLQAGMTDDEIKIYFRNAKNLDPVELKTAREFMRKVIQEFYPTDEKQKGYLTPFEKIGTKILFRPDELSIWTGINGHGKSQLLGQIILHSMQQGAKVCIASLELKPERLLMRMTRQAAALKLPSKEYIQEIMNWYYDKLWIFNLVGNAKSNRLLEVFKYAHHRYGINTFVIDSFMKLDIDEDDYRGQKQLLEKICDFKNEFNCHVHLVVHPRKASDESHTPSKIDVKGTGAITDLADNCFTVWRNKKKEEEVCKLQNSNQSVSADLLNTPDAFFYCDKQRNGEWEGKIPLWFDGDTFQYLNRQSQKPVRYVDYSKLSNMGV